MIWQMIEDWFRGILTDGILSNLSGLFDSVNTEVGEIATQVGTTPAGWNAGIFNMIRSLSENVIVPIAGVIITFVMCYELIQLVIEKNNLHDLDTWIFFKWIFKTFVAVLLVTNTWNIVMGVFDITQSVVNDSAGVIISDTSIRYCNRYHRYRSKAGRYERRRAFGAMVSITLCGAYHESVVYLYHAGGVRAHD